jgi:hypothetical protein
VENLNHVVAISPLVETKLHNEGLSKRSHHTFSYAKIAYEEINRLYKKVLLLFTTVQSLGGLYASSVAGRIVDNLSVGEDSTLGKSSEENYPVKSLMVE